MRYFTKFTLTDSGDVQIPMRIKERHYLDGYEPERAVAQAIGRKLMISIWSPKDMVEIGLPFEEWSVSSPYGRSLSSGRVNVQKWTDLFEMTEDGGTTKIIGEVTTFDSSEWILKHPENI